MIYFTPGPTQLYPTVKKHIQSALDNDILSISHRSDYFHEIVKQSNEYLRKLLDIPENYHIFFTASATEAMERIIENCVDNTSYHFVNGAFSKRFFQIATELKRNASVTKVAVGEMFHFDSVAIPDNTELICFTHNETSAGTAIPMSEIYRIGKKHPDALLALDIVSSAPYVDVDYEKLDCVFFSIQKGFGLPAGLGILIVSPKAMEKAKQRSSAGKDVGSYHKFETLLAQAQKYQTIETPNVFAIYLLSKVLEDFNKQGIATIQQETEKKAELVYNFFDMHAEMKPLVKDPEFRSKTVIVISTPQGSKQIIKPLKEKGYTIGSGYGELKDQQIRIANFPAHSYTDIKTLMEEFSYL